MVRTAILYFLFVALVLTSCNSNREPQPPFQTPLVVQHYFASEESFGVASTLIEGTENIILVDAQFTRRDAELVLAKIQDSNKHLQSIYISHFDPDYYFGLSVFREAYPDVPIYAIDSVRRKIQETADEKLAYWQSELGDRIANSIIIPDLLPAEGLQLENRAIEVHGEDRYAGNTYLYIPSIRTVIGGINIFGNSFHLWLADAQTEQAKEQWIAVLDDIITLNPQLVIPGHADERSALNLSSVQHSKAYIEFFRAALPNYNSSEGLIALMEERFPSLGFRLALNLAAQVHMGEIDW